MSIMSCIGGGNMKKGWNMKGGNILLVLIASSFFLFGAANVKVTPIGKIVKSIGAVSVVRSGASVVATDNMRIYKNDKILTDDNSIAYLRFKNGNFVRIGENRNVKAAELMKKKIDYKWLERVTRSKVSKDRFVNQAPVSTAGVRGAEKAEKNKLNGNYIWVETQELQK